jgi:protein-disulfide isomerase
MKQGRMFLALALTALLAASAGSATRAEAATKKSPAAAAATAKKSYAFRQFTGVVTALDKSTLTVEKTGKQAKTVVFARHAEMTTTGDLAKDARVTVYYRDEGGQSVAHKVVVKTAPLAASR